MEGRSPRPTGQDAPRVDGAGPTTLADEIAQKSPIGVALIDGDGLMRRINPAFGDIYGHRADDLLGHSFTLLYPPDRREFVLQLHRRFLAGEGELNGDWDLLRPDGSALSVVERSVRLRDEHGRPCRVLYVVDDTVRREAERALRATHRFTQSVLDGLSAHVCVIDHAGSIIAVNRAWRDFAAANGAAAGAVRKGADYIAVCEAAVRSGAPDATEAGPFLDLLRDALAGRRHQFEIAYTCHSPTAQRWFIARVSCIDGSSPPSFVIAHDDVTELQQAQALLRRQASTDELTDTLNRRHFRLTLNAEFERVRRQPGLRSAVLSFDVDHFKCVNDTWGHAAGDAMLQHITRRVRQHTRVIDVVARIGGEEFALLLPDITLDEAVALGRRLGSDVATHPLVIDGQRIDVTISSGISLLDAADDSAEAALLRADQALYDAKNAGRNTVRWRLRE